jgi:hypothetical protein
VFKGSWLGGPRERDHWKDLGISRRIALRWNLALGYGLDDRGSILGGCWEFFSNITASRTALGPTQPPIQWVPGGLSLGVKRPGREADHSPPSTAEVKRMSGAIHPLPQYAFMAWCLVKSTGITLPLLLP